MSMESLIVVEILGSNKISKLAGSKKQILSKPSSAGRINKYLRFRNSRPTGAAGGEDRSLPHVILSGTSERDPAGLSNPINYLTRIRSVGYYTEFGLT